MAHPKVIIIGAGICGLSTALALVKLNEIPASNISVHEIRPIASTIGGAVNLTPNALRYLAALDVLPTLLEKGCETRVIEIISHRTGAKLGEVSFDDLERFGHRALRIQRGDLLEALLKRWSECGGSVRCESRASKADVAADGSVKVTFAGGKEERADFLIGCDGIHSWVRNEFVEPERLSVYSGVAAAYGRVSVGAAEIDLLPFETTAAFSTRRGTLMMSYCNPEKTELYVAGVMQMKEEVSREGWRVKGGDQATVKKDILDRFGGVDGLGGKLHGVIDKIEDWYLYPVHTLTPNGTWSKGPVLLLGDAAHAMPPQGESVGFAIEDAILLSRLLSDDSASVNIEDTFARYERNRRKRIEDAFADASWRWETVKDAGWLKTVAKEYATSAFLWWTKASRDENFAFDVRTMALVD